MLPLDQAEELFSSDAGPEAATFLRLITELGRPDADDQHLGLIVAATIRTDRYELMQSAPELAGLTSEVFDDLKPMPPNQFREVITGPAARASAGGQRLSFAPVLVNRLLEEAAEGGDALPLLALTLRRLYDRYGDTGDITLADYAAMGGMRRVVHNVVDEVLSAEPEQRARQLAELRAAFIPWLATIADNDEPVRRVTRWSDLPEASRPLIDAFVEKRLLVKDQRGGQVVVEVALESLLRQWDDLAGWLRDQREDLKAAGALEHNAAAWEAAHRSPDWLLTGTRLADAEELIAKPGYRERLEPTRDYLAASRQAENQKLAAEEERRQAELRHAEERRQAAEEQQRAAEALDAAETCARVLPEQAWSSPCSRILAVVAVIAVIGVSAVTGFVQAELPASSADQSADRDRAEADRPGAGHAGRHRARRGRAGFPADPGRPHPHHPPTTARSTARWFNGPAPSRSSPATPARWPVWRSAPTGTGWPPPATTARCGCGTPTPANPSATRSPATPTR